MRAALQSLHTLATLQAWAPTCVLHQDVCCSWVVRIGVRRQQVRDVGECHGAAAPAAHLQGKMI